MSGWRVRTSRRLSRLLFGRDEMLCSLVHWRRHPVEGLIDAAFLFIDRRRHHCRDAADWESRQAWEPQDFTDVARDAGWM